MSLKAIDEAHEPLEGSEQDILKLRFGLEYSTRSSIELTAAKMGLTISQVEIFEKNGIRKALYDPISNLINQVMVREDRFRKFGKPEGVPDLEVAKQLLRKAYQMAEILIFWKRG
jgi:hypothetical protein